MGRFLVFVIILMDILAAGCTYVCGTIVVPNVLNLVLWAADSLGRFLCYLLAWSWLPHLPVLPMPLDLGQMAAVRNRSWGLLWLGFYLLTRLSFFWRSSLMWKDAPANRMHSQETRWVLLDQCIKQYQQALTRFLIPPIKLKVPPVFEYEDRAESVLITWRGRTPILPTALLRSQTQQLLATFLALELAKYNSADLFIRAWMSTYPLIAPSWQLSWLGIFFWLPARLLRSGIYKDWSRERELAYDEFAYLCGQGEALLRLLQAQEANNVQMLGTEYEPSTLERIGHLEALLRDEYAQMEKLGLAVPQLLEPLQPRLAEPARGTDASSGASAKKKRKPS